MFILAVVTATLLAQADAKTCGVVKPSKGSTIVSSEVRDYEEIELPISVGEDKKLMVFPLAGRFVSCEITSPQGRSKGDLFLHYQQTLEQAGFRILVECRNKGCAPSNEAARALKKYRMLELMLGAADGLVARGWPGGRETFVALMVRAPEVLVITLEPKAPEPAKVVQVSAEQMETALELSGHIALYGLFFDTGKADVKPASEPTLAAIGKLMKAQPQLTLHVVGHTDNQGKLEANLALSQRRAAAIVKVLSQKYGVSAARLRPAGVGSLAPVATNDTEAGRARNRRVELVRQ